MKISVIGTGYVGLVTGTCFAETGVDVTCVDIDREKVENLRKGNIPIYEPGLETMVKNNVEKKRLYFTTSLEGSIKETDAIFIAVGTPPDEDGSADVQYVLNVARDIAQYMERYMVVVTKSTVPIGTAERVRKAMKEVLDKRGKNLEFDVASNPEFLKEGDAIDDFLKPDRIVIGTDSARAEDILKRLYKPFVLNGHPVISMDIPSAELTKYAANSILATKISFMNDIANLCELLGADVNNVRRGIGSDSRIGHKFLYAGTGYGGSCFPKDVKALIKNSREKKYSLSILEAVETVNDKQKTVLVRKLMEHFNRKLKEKRIALWGLSFKPHTDDMREAPALAIIDHLKAEGAFISAYDPVAMEESKRRVGNTVKYAKDQYDALVDADALLIVTEWPEFRTPNYHVMKKLMKNQLILDGRNIFDLEEMKAQGFTYYSIGRPTIKP